LARADQTSEEDSQCDEERSAVPGETGGLVSPYREYLSYPLMVVALGAVAASHDYPLLPGWFQMSVHRLALIYGVHIFDFQLLLVSQRELFPKELASSPAISSLPDGPGNRSDHHNTRAVLEALVGQKSAFARTAEVSRGIEKGQN